MVAGSPVAGRSNNLNNLITSWTDTRAHWESRSIAVVFDFSDRATAVTIRVSSAVTEESARLGQRFDVSSVYVNEKRALSRVV